ncbi:hypothetical protein [Bradyrhizobium yuanmingense]|uniref:hypothetical protein n=1 Tax=Bradyrhizobium yuanmingense TaxID=108015 RepID=UPI0023B94C19|nr:hypothetical protein [Bradyrhizobium yuanmingense]MDF0580920.1 hypothetical protein [Bradyrhizobium yuanmingense]
MTMNPESEVAARKNATMSAALATICAELPRGVNRLAHNGRGYCTDCGSAATGGKLALDGTRLGLEIRARLASRRISCCNNVHNRNWPFAVRFATLRLKTRTDFREPFVAWHAKKRPRRFYI